jgi:hypothetical protein
VKCEEQFKGKREISRAGGLRIFPSTSRKDIISFENSTKSVLNLASIAVCSESAGRERKRSELAGRFLSHYFNPQRQLGKAGRKEFG